MAGRDGRLHLPVTLVDRAAHHRADLVDLWQQATTQDGPLEAARDWAAEIGQIDIFAINFAIRCEWHLV